MVTSHFQSGRIVRRLTRFRSTEGGGVTIEFVLWLPFMIGVLMFILDTSHVLTTNASMWNATRDTARELAYHRINADEADERILSQVIGPGLPYRVNVTETQDRVEIELRLAAEEAGLMKSFSRILDFDLVARVHMMREPV